MQAGDERQRDARPGRTATTRARRRRARRPRGCAGGRPGRQDGGRLDLDRWDDRARSWRSREESPRRAGPGLRLSRFGRGGTAANAIATSLGARPAAGASGVSTEGNSLSEIRLGTPARRRRRLGSLARVGQALEELGLDPQVLGPQVGELRWDHACDTPSTDSQALHGGCGRWQGPCRLGPAGPDLGLESPALTGGSPAWTGLCAGYQQICLALGAGHDRAGLARRHRQELVASIAAEFQVLEPPSVAHLSASGCGDSTARCRMRPCFQPTRSDGRSATAIASGRVARSRCRAEYRAGRGRPRPWRLDLTGGAVTMSLSGHALWSRPIDARVRPLSWRSRAVTACQARRAAIERAARVRGNRA